MITPTTQAHTSTATMGVNLVPAASDLPYGMLTPDMLISYVAEKLQGIDTQVQQMAETQQKRDHDSAALGTLAQVLGDNQRALGKDDPARGTIDAAYAQAIKDVGADTPLGKKLQAEKDTFDSDAHVGGKADDKGADVDEKGMETYLNNVTRIQSDLNHGGELEMMKLQSLVSTRQQVVQMSTNLISSLGESAKAIASKIGG